MQILRNYNLKKYHSGLYFYTIIRLFIEICIHHRQPKITDFELSKQTNETSMTSNSIIHGIPAYIEPQCLIERGYKHDKTSEIYSFRKSFGNFKRYIF
ncbi:hypothetical protein C2G38_2248139 [Gigaspora rosea]|uniref:Protein kinase domain-containing protein n=1 Tax=Gigaspora rosea TaxID=44941 RepID=A0A397UWG8_9GLOM|nr:hypothetical protein C2G38_2248139 [Gigaspora rosea]